MISINNTTVSQEEENALRRFFEVRKASHEEWLANPNVIGDTRGNITMQVKMLERMLAILNGEAVDQEDWPMFVLPESMLKKVASFRVVMNDVTLPDAYALLLREDFDKLIGAFGNKEYNALFIDLIGQPATRDLKSLFMDWPKA